VAKNIHEAVTATAKTVLACFMGAGESSAGIEYLKDNNVPVYIFPEAIAKTLATIYRHKEWLSKSMGKHRTFKVDSDAVRSVIKTALDAGRKAIVGEEAIAILHAYGIPAAGYRYASTAREAVAGANTIGYPVVMKINTPPILHKTEVGGVMIDLRTDTEVRDAFNELRKRTGKIEKGQKFSVAMQRMMSGGIETVMGMTIDPSFGPLLMFGLGGIYVEVMKDVSFKINPLTDASAKDMIQSIRSYPLLTGFRGAPPVDSTILEETLLRLSQLVSDFDCFAEIDINPFIASPDRDMCKAVDARFIIKECVL